MAGGLPTFLAMNLVTPRGVVALQETDSVQAPGEEGAFELLPGHVPMLAALKAGVLTIGKKTKFAVSSGYLRVDEKNAVEILVEQAMASAAVDVEVAKKDLATADADLVKWGDKAMDGDYQSIVQRQAWAKARIDAAATSH